ncbi:MAG: sigma-70 family RNA polymerase sigma factor [Planctomycetota bacterium]
MNGGFVVDLNSETQLVEAVQNGHLESFGALYERYHSSMVALAYSMLADRDLAEDAAQEVFAIACRDIGSLKSKERFAAWLAGICRNVSRQVLRANKIKPATLSDDCAADNRYDCDDRREAIRRAVWNLREAERELIVLRYFDGFSQAQISEVLGISSQAVNGRLVRAKRKIAKYLKRNGLTGDDHEKSCSKGTRTDFEQWKKQHPQAVEMLTSRAGRQEASPYPLKIRRTTMKSTITKLAAAAVITIAAIAGIYQLTDTETGTPDTSRLVAGPQAIKLVDGSEVQLTEGAQIRVTDAASTRGFEHLAGTIDVSVIMGLGEFIVTTPYGNVKALGTEFTLEMVDGVIANTQEHVQLLAVEVTEGSVEVSNAKGSSILEASRKLIVEPDQKPYDYSQDENLPVRLRERIQSMLIAVIAGDTPAWMANYNLDYMYKLIKDQVEYDPNLFGGSKADAERLQKMGGDINSPQELLDRFIAMGGINKASGEIYVRSVTLNENEDHAVARCMEYVSDNHIIGHTPQWHYFDNDWWQVDD